MSLTSPGSGDDFYRCNGAGEMLVYSAADFEDFLEERPDLAPALEQELVEVVRLLAAHKWPFRIHATYDESIARMLDVFEAVNKEIPLGDTRWFFDHCETISDCSLERVRSLGGGIAIQDRMAFQGEYFLARYGVDVAERTPPIRRMLDLGIPVGAGTDATRVSSYNPWLALYWLVSGRTIGGTELKSPANRLDRREALELYTVGSSWFSGEKGRKGALATGQFADLAVLSDDYFSVAEEAIKGIESVLTIVDGKVVHAAAEFAPLQPSPLPVLPEWSPVAAFGGYGAPLDARKPTRVGVLAENRPDREAVGSSSYGDFWGGTGCDCASI
jgi:predicted amidohydrolase YtcJ